MSAPVGGFWGIPSSSVDWCEANYAHTPYVCELWNTLSSVAMLVAGVLGFLLHRRVLERRFSLAFLIVALVGLGSVAFHGTLRFELQMADELPMLYSALVMLFILTEDRRERRFGAWFPVALVLHGALVTALTALTRGKLQFYLFQASFDSMEVYALYRVFLLYRRSTSSRVRAVYRVGMSAYVLAMVAWFVDFHACDAMRALPLNPELHAVWHVLVSVGLYTLTVVVAFARLEVLGANRDSKPGREIKPELALAYGFVPRVTTAKRALSS